MEATPPVAFAVRNGPQGGRPTGARGSCPLSPDRKTRRDQRQSRFEPFRTGIRPGAKRLSPVSCRLGWI